MECKHKQLVNLGSKMKISKSPFFRELQFIQEVLSWLEQSFRSVMFQDNIGI